MFKYNLGNNNDYFMILSSWFYNLNLKQLLLNITEQLLVIKVSHI